LLQELERAERRSGYRFDRLDGGAEELGAGAAAAGRKRPGRGAPDDGSNDEPPDGDRQEDD
jgi:hypothetical protein